MQLGGLFFFLGFILATGRGETTLDEETEAVFNQLQTALNDKQTNNENQEEVKKLLQEIKDEMTTKKPEYAKNIFAMTKSLASAVPKLKSTNELTVAEGALLVVAGIAEHFPPPVGIVVASLATLVSSILGYLTPTKVLFTRNVLLLLSASLNSGEGVDERYLSPKEVLFAICSTHLIE